MQVLPGSRLSLPDRPAQPPVAGWGYPTVRKSYPILRPSGKPAAIRSQWRELGQRAAHVTDIAAALKRLEKVLLRSPKTGLHADAPATARWNGGTRVTTRHENGTQFATDLPPEVGGKGTGTTPGWLLRAGLASCVTTRIAMAAAVRGIELATLEIVATSRSDARGLLGMRDTHGERVSAGPGDLRLHVKIAAADGTSAEQLRSLVEQCNACSPVSCAVQEMTPIELRIEVG